MNHLANISVFEGLQTAQHARTGMSSMSVFNSAPIAEQETLINYLYAEVRELAPTVGVVIPEDTTTPQG